MSLHCLRAARRVSSGLLVAVAAAVSITACGGSSPTGPPPTTPPAPVTLTFFAAGGNTGANSIGLALRSSDVDSITLTLNATDVAELYGYALDLLYDPAVVALQSIEAGSFLDAQDVTVTTQATEVSPGTIVIGQSRLGSVGGVSGSGVMLELTFTSVAAGSSALNVANTGAFDSTGADLAADFFGGSVTVPAGAQ